MKKSIEQKIAETDELLRQIIGACGLNVSIAELIVRNIHTEIKNIADKNLQNKINEYEGEKVTENAEPEGDDLEDGDSTGN